jgi:hypothetical protein
MLYDALLKERLPMLRKGVKDWYDETM